MSRSGYDESCDDNWGLICWRGAVASALRGRRGQAFLREMVDALDALPEKRLTASALVTDEGCCAMGAVALGRRLDTADVDPFERSEVAELFGIAEAMAAEIAYVNDEGSRWRFREETPEARWQRMREWAVGWLGWLASDSPGAQATGGRP